MATGDVPPSSVGAPEVNYNNNTDPHHSAPREINGTAVAVADGDALGPNLQVNGRSSVDPETATPNGPTASHCDTDNKIVIKSRRSMAGEQSGLAVVDAHDVEDIQRLYETKPEAFRHWLLQRAPSDLLNRLRRAKQQENVSSDLFHKWIEFSPTKVSLIHLYNRRTYLLNVVKLEIVKFGGIEK